MPFFMFGNLFYIDIYHHDRVYMGRIFYSMVLIRDLYNKKFIRINIYNFFDNVGISGFFIRPISLIIVKWVIKYVVLMLVIMNYC